MANGVEVSAAAAAAWHCELELLIPVSVRVAALRGLLLGRRLDMRGGPHLGVPGLRLQQVERRRGAEQLAGALPGRDSLRDAALGRSSRLCEDPAAWRRRRICRLAAPIRRTRHMGVQLACDEVALGPGRPRGAGGVRRRAGRPRRRRRPRRARPGPSRMPPGLGLVCAVAASPARSWRRKGKDGGRGAEVAATAGEAEAMKSSFEKPRPGGGDLVRTIGIGRLIINVDVAQW